MRMPLLGWVLGLLVLVPAARGLTADELLLITNKNLPEGRALAELYARERGVPAGRILEIPLPVTEEVAAEQYDEHIAPAVRQYLEANGLRDQVKCLVTFYGVPLRLRQRPFTALEQAEVAELQREVQRVGAEIERLVEGLEQEVKAIQADNTGPDNTGPDNTGPDNTAPDEAAPGQTPPATRKAPSAAKVNHEDLAKRADAAFKALERALPQLDDAGRRRLMGRMLQVMEALAGPAAIVERVRVDGPADSQQAIRMRQLREKVAAASRGMAELQGEQHDPAVRGRLRQIVREHFGLIAYATLVNTQLGILNPSQTAAAVDSELALLWWEDYPRARWIWNPLHHEAKAGVRVPPVLMVARLDGPSPLVVRRMILDAVAAETTGLKGQLVVDAGGSLTLGSKGARPDEYTKWDDYLKRLARLARERSKLTVMLDESAAVIQPANRVDHVALYCGWYSVRNYVPGLALEPGAVALHIASYEAISVRGENEKGWVAGLLRDGAAASIGAVAEPYLHTFPRPDAFFPLLMTGRVTLAEAYWRTTPTVSWMMVLFGDPLYRPYARTPALELDALPPSLRRGIEEK